MSVIVLLAVGSDYNLLLVSRFKQEIHAGLNTGIIRSMGGTGKVVTNAGLIFAFTMASMVVSDVRMVGQVGTTIGLGLLFDTLVVRAFMTPSVAALLGRWFWWPIRVRSRPPRPRAAPVQPDPDHSLAYSDYSLVRLCYGVPFFPGLPNSRPPIPPAPPANPLVPLPPLPP